MSKLIRESIRKMITQELKSINEDTGTVKEVSLSMLRVSPDNVKDMAIETAVSMLGIQEKEGYHVYKLNIDGIEFDCSYSPYYQQDENWRGYVDIKIDLKKFDKKVVAAFLKSLKEQFKKNRNESINETETKNQYTYIHNPKTNKFDVLKVKDGVKVTAFSTEDQASKHVDKINSLGRGYAKIRGKVTEGTVDNTNGDVIEKDTHGFSLLRKTNMERTKLAGIVNQLKLKYPKLNISVVNNDQPVSGFKYIVSADAMTSEREVKEIQTVLDAVIPSSGVKESSITEGPEERLGAYRRLVITSTKIPALKAEFTKFTARPEIKADFPVKMTFFDSPKPNVLVVDLNGDNATVLATKFSDIIKRTDSAAEILVRKEKKLK